MDSVISESYCKGIILHRNYRKMTSGQPRYLKVQGNGENTWSYSKFDISKM